MIWLVAASLAAEPMAGSVGVGLDLAAVRGSSRHDVAAGLRAWGTVSPQPWSATFEVAVVPHVDHTGLYTYRSLDVDTSALAEAVFAPHATAFRAGLGPALIVRTTTFRSDDLAAAGVALEGGVRARVALDGPLGKRKEGGLGVAWTWHMAGVAHPSGVDWDTGFGLGVAL